MHESITCSGSGSDDAQSLDARSKGTSAGYSSTGMSDIDRLAHCTQVSFDEQLTAMLLEKILRIRLLIRALIYVARA